MSFVLTFSASGMSAGKYDEVITRLNDAGAGTPKGRSYHVCYGNPDNLHITDIWDSMEEFQAFGQTLMPILEELGIDPGKPVPEKVHNIIEG